MDADRASRRRVGLILGAVGLVLLFGPSLLLLLVPAFALLFVGTMVVGIFFLIAAFVTVPRKR